MTSDIVWLESQAVQLPDGSIETVLVPKVYLAHVDANAVKHSGALVTGATVTIEVSETIMNQGGVIDSGNGRTLLLAGEDIVNRGGTIKGGDVALQAGRDIKNETLTVDSKWSSKVNGGSYTSLSNQGSISATGGLVMDAGRNLTDLAGTINAGGSASIFAGNNISFDTVKTGSTEYGKIGGTTINNSAAYNQLSRVNVGGDLLMAATGNLNLTGTQVSMDSGKLLAGGSVNIRAVTDEVKTNEQGQRGKNWSRDIHENQAVVGAQVSSANDLLVSAGINQSSDLKVMGSTVAAGGTLTLKASNDVNITSVSESHLSDTASHSEKKRTVGKRTSTIAEYSNLSQAIGSNLEGRNIDVQAGNDLNVKGSSILGDDAVSLRAAGNINIEAAQNTLSQSSFQQKTKSGLMSGGGVSITAGKQMKSQAQEQQQTTAAASTVGSLGGNVSINAGKTFTQTGSDILTPQGNIDITAKTVNITEARETGGQNSESKFKQSGVTLAVTSPVISALQGVRQQTHAAKDTGSDRMKALAAANAAMQIKQGVGEVQSALANKDATGGVGISLSAGTSSSKSNQQSNSDSARGSTMTAGGNIAIRATGAGQGSDITIRGSDVKATGTTVLKADDEVNLLAAKNSTTESSSQSSKSGSVGIAFKVGGSENGFGITVSGSKGTGKGAGNSTTYTNTHVEGANVQIDSGANTTLSGATITGQKVAANVGGNLVIESLKDKSEYHEKSQTVGGSVMFGAGGGGSVNVGKTKINSDFLSVGEQSAIRAGDGGFNVNVQGKTTLTGGQITSSQAAIDEGKNSFTSAGGTQTQDLQNSAKYSAQSVSVGVAAGEREQGKPISAGMSGIGVGSDSGNASSITTAGISGIIGDANARTGDKTSSLTQIFDKEKVQKEVAAQTAITAEFGKQASKLIGDYAEKQFKEAESTGDKAGMDAWKEGGTSRVALHAMVGGLTGGAAGVIGAGAASAAAPAIDKLQGELREGLLNAALGESASNVISGLAGGTTAATIGSAASAGSVAGAAAAFNEDMNNRQLHYSTERPLIKKLAEELAAEFCKGNSECKKNAYIMYGDALERVAKGMVDEKEDAKNTAYIRSLMQASQSPTSEGGMGDLALYVGLLSKAREALSKYVGQPMLVNGKPLIGKDGIPLTYFSATKAERADDSSGTIFGGKPDAIVFGAENRAEKRVDDFAVQNGSAKKDYLLEETLLGGKVVDKTLSALGKLWMGLDGAMSYEAAATAKANVIRIANTGKGSSAVGDSAETVAQVGKVIENGTLRKPDYIATSQGDVGATAGLGPRKLSALERELQVVEITGGKSAQTSRVENGRVITEDTPITRDGQVISGIDVFGKNGELIQVGGPGKNANDAVFERTKRALAALKEEAMIRGTRAQVYYEAGNSERFKDLIRESQRILGKENVFVLPAKKEK